jgi:hypothetical protein
LSTNAAPCGVICTLDLHTVFQRVAIERWHTVMLVNRWFEPQWAGAGVRALGLAWLDGPGQQAVLGQEIGVSSWACRVGLRVRFCGPRNLEICHPDPFDFYLLITDVDSRDCTSNDFEIDGRIFRVCNCRIIFEYGFESCTETPKTVLANIIMRQAATSDHSPTCCFSFFQFIIPAKVLAGPMGPTATVQLCPDSFSRIAEYYVFFSTRARTFSKIPVFW